MTQRNTDQTVAWLAADRAAHRTIWLGKCLVRARSGRNINALFPSALAAQHGTPMGDRVYHQDDFRRGMVCFLDNPHDSNPFGHIVTILGRTKDGTILVDTNDALIRGGGSVVSLGWFPQHWGVSVQFAATSLNGVDLDLPDHKPRKPKPKPQPKPTLDNVQYALHRLDMAISHWKHEGHHPGLVKALQKDRDRVKQTLDRFGR